MGVHGLWRLLETTGKPINPETLEGKILAVDISIWLNQALKGVRDREGISIQNAHLLTLFNRICKLLFFRIKPVFVFDGEAPLLKRQTLALRRQRKEEMNVESKQTNEKLLKTFLKRQAIKAALGNSSKDPLPSLASVRRDEVDDMYVLPALPAAEERDKSSSSEEEEDRPWGELTDSHQMIRGELFEDPNSVDVNSEEFSSLPPEMKHEMLKDMKEFSKRRRTMFYKPPADSGEFSQYQLAGLLQRNKLNQHLEGVEKEMSELSASGAQQLYEQDGEEKHHSVESNRLVSEDHSHYILIKGYKKSEIASESRPAAPPWSGNFLPGNNRRATGRPEPLWGPVCEDEKKSKGSDITASKPLQGEASPPSPRTLRAIQAAMDDGSDEEKTHQNSNGGGLSPRTLLAVRQALNEEEESAADYMTEIGRSATKLRENSRHPAPQAVIISSEEEPEPDNVDSLPNERPNLKRNTLDRSFHVKDSLLASSSEDEMEEVIRQQNKTLPILMLRQPDEKEVEETTEGRLTKELEKRRLEEGSIVQTRDRIQPLGAAAVSNQSTSPSGLCPQISEKPLCPEVETHPALLKLGRDGSDEAAEGRNVDDAKSEDSESEESFIEVSEEESRDDSHVANREKEPPYWLNEDQPMKEEVEEEGSVHSPGSPAAVLTSEEDKKTEEEDMKEGTETESSAAPAVHEWENFDMDELEALESSLQVEQSSLEELKEQQERMASTVTGQMYLESQDLLRLFGIPFLVAPMEAEAQCAALDHGDQTHGTITDDSDVWLFGGRHVYKNFFSQNKYVEHYQSSDLQSQLGLDRNKLINLAYLLGSDYTEGVPGVGFVTGMEILNEFPGTGLEPLTAFSKWWSEAQEKKRLVADPQDTKVKKKLRHLKLHPGFPNPAVAQAYLQPAVDPSDSSFSWGRPQLDMIKDFCLSRFGWSSRRTEETLQPVIKQLNSQQTQLRIDSFFRMEQREKAIRSQRLRRAVTCMKRKERGGGEEGEDSEEEIPAPSKSMRGKEIRKTPKSKGGEREKERFAAGGGFLGSEVIFEPPLISVKDGSSTSGESIPIKALQSTQTPPQRARRSSTSSSGEDSDDGGKVAMVTARSVFDSSLRGRGAKSTRGRRNLRGKRRGKKL